MYIEELACGTPYNETSALLDCMTRETILE
jgi:hypothetical protein